MPIAYTFEIGGMHCASCSLLIDETLEDLPGVAASNTSVTKGHTVVELDTERISTEEVAAAISQLGYHARLVS